LGSLGGVWGRLDGSPTARFPLGIPQLFIIAGGRNVLIEPLSG